MPNSIGMHVTMSYYYGCVSQQESDVLMHQLASENTDDMQTEVTCPPIPICMSLLSLNHCPGLCYPYLCKYNQHGLATIRGGGGSVLSIAHMLFLQDATKGFSGVTSALASQQVCSCLLNCVMPITLYLWRQHPTSACLVVVVGMILCMGYCVQPFLYCMQLLSLMYALS